MTAPIITRQRTYASTTVLAGGPPPVPTPVPLNGPQPSVNADPMQTPFTLTVMVTVPTTTTFSGTAPGYAVEFSLDDPFTTTDANANWLPSQGLPGPELVSAYTQFTAPIQRVRVNIAGTGSGITGTGMTGTMTFEVLQGV